MPRTGTSLRTTSLLRRTTSILAAGIAVFAAATAVAAPANAEPGPNGGSHGGHDPDVTVFAHRGASAYLPELTMESIELALDQGSDGVEIDLVLTADGELILRHEAELSHTTDVADHPEFADRETTRQVDGRQVTGWFADDFTLAEIKTLRAVERIPELRPQSAVHDGQFEIITYDEVLDYLKAERRNGRKVTLSTELKVHSYYAEEGLDIARAVADVLDDRRLDKKRSWVWVQSFDFASIAAINELIPNTLGVNISGNGPLDTAVLDEVAEFADTVSLNKNRIIPRDSDGFLTEPTTVIEDAHERGLDVHSWTFRAENSFLPADFRSGDDAAAWGDWAAEYQLFYGLGLDAVFTDNADLAIEARDGEDEDEVTVIAHRGASGYVPEHTLEAYELALGLGADVIEPDLVLTGDGHLLARHEPELSDTTDVADHPEFADRKTTRDVEGTQVTGWFADDFTLAELKTLRAEERLGDLRTRSAGYDGQFQLVSYEEILDFAAEQSEWRGREIVTYPEMKHPAYYESIGLSIEETLAETLDERGLGEADSPAWIQSFDLNSLVKVSGLVDNPVGLNIGGSGPIDPTVLDELAAVVDVVSVNKNRIVPRDADGNLLEPTTLIEDAHERGLEVHSWTFRNENTFLPADFRNGSDAATWGDYRQEYELFYDLGVDAVFSDYSDKAVAAR